MKNKLVRLIRRVLPAGSVQHVEELYRRARIWLVRTWYGNPARHLKVIAVTGTNGKTTTVSYLNEMIKQSGLKTAMFSTAVIEVAGERRDNDLNMTVASTIEMQRFFRDAKRARVDYVVLEITSHSLHQHKLDGVPIEAAIMTNLTQDHLDYHKTMEAYAAAKGLLFARLPRFIVLNRDDRWYEFYNQYTATERKVSYGTSADAITVYKVMETNETGSQAHIVFDKTIEFGVTTSLPGTYNAANLAAAATTALLIGIDTQAIRRGIEALRGVPGRFEHIETNRGFDAVVDYAHTPDALEKLLQTARSMTTGRLTLVFGACGDRDKSKRPIMGEIAAHLADAIYLTDEESYAEDPASIRHMIYAGIRQGNGDTKTIEIADRRQAIEAALSKAQSGDRILITGMGHEQYRIIRGKKIPWNDATIVRELLKTL